MSRDPESGIPTLEAAAPTRDTEHARQELSHFLRSRRERLHPGQVGFPAGGRLRAPGLRREEVAELCGISADWYTRLEQGRPVRASGEVLDRLAQALRLDTAERAHLFDLAHRQPPPYRGERRARRLFHPRPSG